MSNHNAEVKAWMREAADEILSDQDNFLCRAVPATYGPKNVAAIIANAYARHHPADEGRLARNMQAEFVVQWRAGGNDVTLEALTAFIHKYHEL